MKDESTLGTEYLLPYERGDSPADVMESLSDVLADDESAPTDTDEPAPEEVEQIEDELDEGESEAEEDPAEDESEDDEESEDSVEEEPADPVYRVKVDGEEIEVPLPELLKGYSRTSDYTRKTTDLANQRKALEAHEAEIRAARDEYARKLEVVAQIVGESLPPEPDWDKIRKESPDEFPRLYAEHKLARERAEVVAAERAAEEQKRTQQEQSRLQAHLEAETARLLDSIPEWKDEPTATSEKTQLVDYATKTYGWTPDDLGNVHDHRLVLLLRKAMKYDEIQAKGQTIREKAKTAPVLKPGGRTQAPKAKGKNESTRRIGKLAQTGRVDDAKEAIEGLLRDF